MAPFQISSREAYAQEMRRLLYLPMRAKGNLITKIASSSAVDCFTRWCDVCIFLVIDTLNAPQSTGALLPLPRPFVVYAYRCRLFIKKRDFFLLVFIFHLVDEI